MPWSSSFTITYWGLDTYRGLSARLQLLQWVSNRVTAVLHWAIDICVNLVSMNICSGDILPSFELATPSTNDDLFSARSIETHFSKDLYEETSCHLVLILTHLRIFTTKYIFCYIKQLVRTCYSLTIFTMIYNTIFNGCLLILLLSKVNIWNVNYARAITLIFDTRTDALLKVSKFLRQKMSRPQGDSNTKLGIHAECSNHLSYQGQTFAIPCFWRLALVVYIFLKLSWHLVTSRGQQHSFSTYERMFLWKRESFWDRKMSRPEGDSNSDSDSDRGLFNIKLHTKVLHQVYIAKQYEHIEQIWTWHNQKYLLGDLY